MDSSEKMFSRRSSGMPSLDLTMDTANSQNEEESLQQNIEHNLFKIQKVAR